MTIKAWPTEPRNGPAPVAPQVPEGSPSVPVVDLGEMTPAEIEAKAQELGDGLRAARSEMDEAAVSLATTRAGLVEAAGRGFEAAKAAQRKIAEAEERLRTAEAVVEAVSLAHRPFAEEAHRLSRVRTTERFAEAQAAKIRERDGIEAELLAALDVVADATVRWERATTEALEIRRSAAAGGFELPYTNLDYRADTVTRAIQSLGIPLARAVAS